METDILFIKLVIHILSLCMLQSCLTLCNPMDCSLPASSVHGILQARILEWVAMPSSRGSSWPRDQTHVSCVSCIAGRFFTTEPLGSPLFIIPEFQYCSAKFWRESMLPQGPSQCLVFPRSSMLLLWYKDELREASGMCEFIHSLSLWPSLDGHHVTEWQPADLMGSCTIA